MRVTRHRSTARLRAEAPVYFDAVNELWGISRYADIVDVEKHAARYSSSRGSRPKIVGDVSSINNDDPLHQNKRRLVARRFTPKSVKEHEDHIRGVVNELIDAVIERGECDVVRALAAPLPARRGGAARLRARPLAEVPRMVRGHDVRRRPVHRRRLAREVAARTVNTVLEFTVAAQETIAARRADPRDDLISVWAHSEVEFPDGTVRRLDDGEIVHEALLVLDGGAETTRTVIGAVCVELARRPEQRQLLLDDPTRIGATAVEEFIRWVTPILNMRRTATETHELHGQTIRRATSSC